MRLNLSQIILCLDLYDLRSETILYFYVIDHSQSMLSMLQFLSVLCLLFIKRQIYTDDKFERYIDGVI